MLEEEQDILVREGQLIPPNVVSFDDWVQQNDLFSWLRPTHFWSWEGWSWENGGKKKRGQHPLYLSHQFYRFL